jgi:uracil-DNA glycosylase family 4
LDERKTQIFIHDLQEHLRYLSELGADFVAAPLPETEPPASAQEPFQDLLQEIRQCQKCQLSRTRTQAVPGEGSPQADLVFVGEGPGHDEDAQGRPFVGRAGQLLTKIIKAMGYERHEVYITNIVKCRPPQNRNPLREEMESCAPFLERQLVAIRPRVIVTLGNVPTRFLLHTTAAISGLRGRFQEMGEFQVMPTFHPSYLVRNEQNREFKRLVWEDMQKVMDLLGKR